jgi:hypothetical protein
MIKTVTVDIINEKALKLLQDLEGLQLIRLRKDKSESQSVDFSRYKGAMGKQPIEDVNQQLGQLRNQWE